MSTREENREQDEKECYTLFRAFHTVAYFYVSSDAGGRSASGNVSAGSHLFKCDEKSVQCANSNMNYETLQQDTFFNVN